MTESDNYVHCTMSAIKEINPFLFDLKIGANLDTICGLRWFQDLGKSRIEDINKDVSLVILANFHLNYATKQIKKDGPDMGRKVTCPKCIEKMKELGI